MNQHNRKNSLEIEAYTNLRRASIAPLAKWGNAVIILCLGFYRPDVSPTIPLYQENALYE
jgi:hypothetical protein